MADKVKSTLDLRGRKKSDIIKSEAIKSVSQNIKVLYQSKAVQKYTVKVDINNITIDILELPVK
jgi:hypothetical protein